MAKEERAKVRKEVRLTKSELARADALAKRAGFSLNRWIFALINARLDGSPQLGQQELEGLARSNLQLLAVGRNLNPAGEGGQPRGPDPGPRSRGRESRARAHRAYCARPSGERCPLEGLMGQISDVDTIVEQVGNRVFNSGPVKNAARSIIFAWSLHLSAGRRRRGRRRTSFRGFRAAGLLPTGRGRLMERRPVFAQLFALARPYAAFMAPRTDIVTVCEVDLAFTPLSAIG